MFCQNHAALLICRAAWFRDLTWFDANKSYFTYTWQLFCFKFNHPWCLHTLDGIIILVLSNNIQLQYVVTTNIWYWDLVKSLRPKLEISKFVHFAEIFQKINFTTWKLNFFQIYGIFPICFSCVLFTNTKEKTCWITEVLKS